MKTTTILKRFGLWLLPFLLPLTATAEHNYVDLGLPSGTLWADCNVGASTPEGYGNFYAWGETSTKSSYSWSNYLYASGSSSTVQDIGTHIAGTNYDAATKNWGSDWAMPTLDQANELLTKCTLSFATVNNVKGLRFKGPNGNTIFFPMTGYKEGANYNSAGTETYIWTDTKDIVSKVAYKSMAIYLMRSSSSAKANSQAQPRSSGFVVRAVKKSGGGETSDEEGYAVYNSNTLTFYYDANKASRSGTKYSLNTGANKPGWNEKAGSITKVVFDSSFAEAYPTTTYYWFADMSKLTSINGLEYLMTEDVTNMAYMFYGCSKLVDLDLGTFQTDAVTNMSYMFSGCTSLSYLVLYNISYGMEYVTYSSTFVTKSATNLSYMFAGCSSLTDLVLVEFIVKSSTNTTNMLKGCTSLSSLYINTNLNSLNANALSGVGTASNPCLLEFHEWEAMPEPSSIKPTYYVWKGGYFHNVQTGYAQLSSDGKTLTFKYDIFDDLSWTGDPIPIYSLNTGAEKPEWSGHVANVTKVVFEERFKYVRPSSCSQWFDGMTSLKTITGLDYLITSEVTNMSRMFANCKGLTSLDLSKFTIPSSNTSNMMYKCSGLKTLSIPTTASRLNANACTGVGTTSAPCNLVCPSGFTPERQSSGSGWFQWKSGYFKDEAQPSQFAKGDVNHDGSVDISDVMMAVNHMLGKKLHDFFAEEAETNQDGTIDIVDVMNIVNIMLGSMPPTPPTPPTPSEHNYVDLGLPSGTLWADCNVGASAPEEYGKFYAWGETSTKTTYSWSNYQYCSGSQSSCQDLGIHIAGTQYDAATKEWGGEWVMPTLDQANELLTKCTVSKTTVNNVPGLRFKGPNGNTIFFPMTGYKSDSNYSEEGAQTYLWTDTKDIVTKVAYKSMALYMERSASSAKANTQAAPRRSGVVVRAVRK